MPICTACLSDKTSLLGVRCFLKKYDANIYNCKWCNLIFVENPHWLDEAYSIKYEEDIDAGRYWRNNYICSYMSYFYKNDNTYTLIDIGSGSEKILENEIKKSLPNIDATSYDKYFDNNISKLNSKYNILTAIEVVEHIPPKEFWDAYINIADEFIITTGIHDDVDNVLDWGYFARDYGQHINLYSSKTARYIAKKYNMSVSITENGDLNIIHYIKKSK